MTSDRLPNFEHVQSELLIAATPQLSCCHWQLYVHTSDCVTGIEWVLSRQTDSLNTKTKYQNTRIGSLDSKTDSLDTQTERLKNVWTLAYAARHVA